MCRYVIILVALIHQICVWEQADTRTHTDILLQYTFAKRVDVLKCLVTFVNECGQDSNELKCKYLTSLLDSAFRRAVSFYLLDRQVYSFILS